MKVVILAGGKGTRLWPLSRNSFPKQLLCLGDQSSFLQKTILRFLGTYGPENIVVVTNADCFSLVRAQCLELDPKGAISILVESYSRGTSPALALALCFLQERKTDPLEPILLVPSDGLISLPQQFLDSLSLVKKSVVESSLVLFGAVPSRAESGYGYIEIGEEDDGLSVVTRFIEKPSLTVAEILFQDRRVLWNTGHLLLCTKVFWEEMSLYRPEIAYLQGMSLEEAKIQVKHLMEISLDYALLENSQRVYVSKMKGAWSDIGSWDSVYEVFEKDARGNVRIGNVVDIDSKNCLFIGEKRLISSIGLEDLFVIETGDSIFIGKKGESQRVKELSSLLVSQSRKESKDPYTVLRPWGSYTVLEEGDGYKIKKIIVAPKSRLSLQLHMHRSEHWVVLKGSAFVEVGEESVSLLQGGSVSIPAVTSHRLSNNGEGVLEIMEVQSGEILEESDIIRFEDDYARIPLLC